MDKDIVEEIRDKFIKYDVKEMPYQKHLNSIASSIKGDSLIKIYECDGKRVIIDVAGQQYPLE